MYIFHIVEVFFIRTRKRKLMPYLTVGELSISNATLEERDEEFTKYRQELNEKVEELNYVGKSLS